MPVAGWVNGKGGFAAFEKAQEAASAGKGVQAGAIHVTDRATGEIDRSGHAAHRRGQRQGLKNAQGVRLRPGIIIKTDHPFTVCMVRSILHAPCKPTGAPAVDGFMQAMQARVCLGFQPVLCAILTGVIHHHHG